MDSYTPSFCLYPLSFQTVVSPGSERRHPSWLCCTWVCVWRHSHPGVWRNGGIWTIQQQCLWAAGYNAQSLKEQQEHYVKYKNAELLLHDLCRPVAGCGRSWSHGHRRTLHLLALVWDTVSLSMATSVICLEGWPMTVKTQTVTCLGECCF